MKERPDCPHYSTRGLATQHWFGCDFKQSRPLAFVTTVRQLRETFERYASQKAYSKKICTIGASQKRDFNYFSCGEGNGYK